MSTYVKRKCGNCGYNIEGWTRDYRAIGEPVTICPNCKSYIKLSHQKEWKMMSLIEQISWIISPISNLMYGIMTWLTIYVLGAQILKIPLFEDEIMYLISFLLGVLLRSILLYIRINQSNERMNDSEYRRFLREVNGIYTRDYYGKESYKGEYMDGNPNGTGALFHKNGALKYEGNLKNGISNGYGKEWWDDGNLKYEGEFLNGEYHGFGKLYDNNSNLKYEGEFLNDKTVNIIESNRKCNLDIGIEVEEIKKEFEVLKNLKKEGIITDDEYRNMIERCINKIEI
ncbi:hypothetical protein [Tepidibacter sp. Z1-5]|uniref:hypothetical protein n=1 Tax=Tepidibacter sp. Z1-5 TaxID=3134138 RepID=UPI0030BE7034